jgi:probable addiction module antidote protein
MRAALDDAAGLLALRDVAEAYGGLGMVAEQAGISREALYRSLSPKGNPTLKTLRVARYSRQRANNSRLRRPTLCSGPTTT